VTFWLLLFSN